MRIDASISVAEAGAQVASFQIENVTNFVEHTEQGSRVTDLRLSPTGKSYVLVQVRPYPSDLCSKCTTKILYKCVLLTNL